MPSDASKIWWIAEKMWRDDQPAPYDGPNDPERFFGQSCYMEAAARLYHRGAYLTSDGDLVEPPKRGVLDRLKLYFL